LNAGDESGAGAALLARAWRSRRGRELLHYKLVTLGHDPALEFVQIGRSAAPDGAALAERMGAAGSAWRLHAAPGPGEPGLTQTVERLRDLAAGAGASMLVAEVPDDADCAPWLAELLGAGFVRCARVPDLYADGVDCLIVVRPLLHAIRNV
jgi:hypothetical protein